MTQPQPGGRHPWDDPAGYRPGQPGMPPPVPYTGPPMFPAAPADPEPLPSDGHGDVRVMSSDDGLPPGARQHLLSAPLGRHGALAGSSWMDRAQRPTPFALLIVLELRTLADTMSGRLLLALSPVWLVLATWYLSTDAILTAAPTTAAVQVFGIVVACQVGPIPIYVAVLRTFGGGWHHGSIQHAFLLQPRPLRQALAQLCAALGLWVAMSLLQFGVFCLLRSPHTRSDGFPDFVGSRPLWVLAVALLGGLLTMLFLLCVAFLVANPAMAVAVYPVLSGFFLFRVVNPPVLRYFDPWQPASLLAGEVGDPLPAITSAVVLVAAVAWGCFRFARRHGPGADGRSAASSAD